MKKWLALVLCLCLAAACVPALGEGENVYRSLYSSEVSTLNYLTASTQWDQTVGANVIDTLVEYDAYGNVVPSLAESWETSEDGCTWTFHLRAGQKWYDYQGNAVADVTAQDFVDGLEWVLNPANDSSVEYAVETAKIVNASAYYEKEITDFAEVGVKAVDELTLTYTTEAPVPYFLSCLTYGCFMPAYGPFLSEQGADFGTSNDKMLYNGAYIMSEFQPQVKHTYVKNVNNWDAEHIYIDRIERSYNSDSAIIAPEMVLRGEIDSASLSNDILDDWLETHGDIVTRGRPSLDYSYFYCFNFDPQFDAEYEPENWLIAVNNSNFRHSIMSAFDRIYAMYALEPTEPEETLQNTITPAGFATAAGDFAAEAAFSGTEENFYNEEKALEYKAKAVEELTAAGATFPVKVVLGYRSDMSDWENECALVKQQLEGVLGSDYIDVVLYAGPAENFLREVRRSGKYGLMRCNWGADYADPETWTDPFAENVDSETGLHNGNSYNKMDKMLDTDFEETKAILTEYYAKVAEGKASVTDFADRYAKFAEAEAMLINNALVIPYKISSNEYNVTKLNIFEGGYAGFGITNIRYKGQKVLDDFFSAEQYEAAYADWMEKMGY